MTPVPGPAAIWDPAADPTLAWWLTALYSLTTALVLVVAFSILRPVAVDLRGRARQVRHRRRIARSASPVRARRGSHRSARACAHRSPGGEATPLVRRMAGGVAPQAAADLSSTPELVRSVAFHHAGSAT